jgi:predicted nicotinamide N-methyase
MDALESEAREVPLVPEIRIFVADALVQLWESALARDASSPLPYFAAPWLGGQALARYVLDHPELVRDRSVLDVGTGSGLCAIAAALAGAASVRGVDVDPRAIAAARRNAQLEARSASSVRFELVDVLDHDTPEDVILIGDLFYERDVAARVDRWMRARAESARVVLVGDPGRAYFPTHGVRKLAHYEVPTRAELEGRTSRAAGVYQVERR